MRIRHEESFKKPFSKLPKTIQEKFFNVIELFIENRKHPSLHIEKLEPKILNKWSMRVDRNYRIIFEFGNNDTVLLIDIGRHEKIYKKYP